MADLAAKLIDPKFANMKKEFKYNRRMKEGHDFWECKPLSWMNLEYAAIDGYLSYEIYNKIYTVNEGQAHLQRSDHICPRCKNQDESSSMTKRKKQALE
jgi:phage FluMu protein Com